MKSVLRAKVNVNVIDFENDGEKRGETISANGVYSADPASENHSWSIATPHLSLVMTVNNEKAFGKLEAGKEYYLDFIPVD